jgi:predicted GNAT family N-acyltransferase
MIEDRYFIEPAVWTIDEAALKAVRTRVFIEEQDVPEADEWDTDDLGADHALARTHDGVPIGTGRLTPDGRIGRMAVLREWRAQGVGAALLRHLIERARERGMRRLQLHSQAHAIPFYASFGFVAKGEEFIECDMPHQSMVLELPPPAAAPMVRNTLIGANNLSKRLTSERAGDLRDLTLELIQSARHELCIYTRDLEPAIYDDGALVEAIRHVALSGRGAHVRILVQDTARALRDGHRLLDLAQRLSSIVHIRRPAHEDQQYAGAFVLTDNGGYFFRTFGDRFEGEGDLYYPPRRDELKRYFDEVWERAEQPPELRRLSL